MLRVLIGVVGLALFAVAGCGGVDEEEIQVSEQNDPLFQPRQILQRYADGQQMTSEVSMFPSMVEAVKKVDPERGAILEKGFEDLKKATPAQRKTLAAELLKKLQPDAGYPETPPAES